MGSIADVQLTPGQPLCDKGVRAIAEQISGAERGVVAEESLVDNRDQPEKLEQRVLQRRCCQQQLEEGLGCIPQVLGSSETVAPVDVAQAVRLVKDDEVPLPAEYVFGLGSRKLVGRDRNPPVLEEGRRRSLSPSLAQRCAIASPASIVLPSPTSSASKAPFERGDDSANSATST